MDAQQAKQIASYARSYGGLMERVFTQIKTSAEIGSTSLIVRRPGLITDDVITTLRELGYVVEETDTDPLVRITWT